MFWIFYVIPMVMLLMSARGILKGNSKKMLEHFNDSKTKAEYKKAFKREATIQNMRKSLALCVAALAFIPVLNIIFVILAFTFK